MTNEQHLENLKNKYYREGFEACENKNPYPFPEELSRERLKLVVKKEFLKEDKNVLKCLNEQIDETPWSQWQAGHYMRKYFK